MSLTPPQFIRLLRRRERETPNGTAVAVLTCRCGEQATFPLYNDGQYLGIAGPVYANEGDWVVREGFQMDGSDTVVRCPEHRSEVITDG